MRGILHYVYPDRPMDVMNLSVPPDFTKFQSDVGGDIEIIRGWDQHYTFSGGLVPATVLCNIDGVGLKLPFNFWATAAWQSILGAKGDRLLRPLNTFRLYGTVIIVTGDIEFLDAILG